MKVSIIIPYKNTAEFLPECIESIISQSYQDWEVIAINDSSTDNSLSILEEYAKTDARINTYPNDGQGIIPALRTAYNKSTGEFVTRMDSDDIMTPNKLAVMVNSLMENGKGHVAVGLVKYFSDHGISNGYQRYEEWLNKLTAEGLNFSERYKECVIPSPCWMVYRSDFDLAGGFLPDRYPEDYDLTFRFFEVGLQIIPCQELLHYWRDYSYRTSRTHEHYAQNYFLDIKTHYFLKLDYDPSKKLVLLGAGFKGKSIAKSLIEKQIPFLWVCDNPNKIGKHIYDQPLLHYSILEESTDLQSIITVANEEAQKGNQLIS